MKYIFYQIISMPCETDLEKAKREFSFLGKPEVYDKIYAFSGFKINNIYNDKIFLEHFSKNISFKVDLFVLKCAVIILKYQFDADSTPINQYWEDRKLGLHMFFKERKEFKNLEIKSISEFSKLILSKFYNVDSFADLNKDIDIEDDPAKEWENLFNAVKKYTCVIPNIFSFSISQDTSDNLLIEGEGSSSDNIIVDTKNIVEVENLKIWDEGMHHYFKGDLGALDRIMISRFTLFNKVDICNSQLEDALSQISKRAKDFTKKLTNKNPIFWEEASLEIEVLQLEYLQVQSLIFTLLSKFKRRSFLRTIYSDKYYKDLLMDIEPIIKFVESLSDEVISALKNISTPIKVKNDFKLQESTDKVNDRILFLSFIAMSIPLISYLTSSDIENQTKMISAGVILFLPFMYYFANKFYKNRLSRLNRLSELEESLKAVRKSQKSQEKRIKEIKALEDDDEKKLYSFELKVRRTNIEGKKIQEAKIKARIEKV